MNNMKKRFIKHALLIGSLFALVGCSYEFNFRLLNIDTDNAASFGKDKDFQVIQVNDKLIWGAPNSGDSYIYELCKNGTAFTSTLQCSYDLSVNDDKEGDKFSVVAVSSTGIRTTSKKTKIKAYSAIPARGEADIRFVGWANPGLEKVTGEFYLKGDDVNSYPIHNNDVFVISNEINTISIENFEEGNHQFKFQTRKTPINIYLKDSNIQNLLTTNGSLFTYEGSSDRVLFNFIAEGENTIGGGINAESHYGINTISLPRVSFNGDGILRVVGGHSSSHTEGGDDSDSGFAVDSSYIYNFMPKDCLQLVGGNGGQGKEGTRYRGGKGHFPLNSGVMIKSSFGEAVSIKCGDGGKGANYIKDLSFDHAGTGGDTYSFKYLINKQYPNYAYIFNGNLGDPTPGEGGDARHINYKGASGNLIDE